MISEDSMMTIQPNDVDIVKIPKDIPVMDIEDYDLFDDKEREKYINDLERHVRSSYEYRNMVQYLREYMNMNSCAFIPNVTNEVNRKIKIELHHSPFTLRDICVTILNKRIKNNEILTIESVAYEVMFVHYSLMVGLIPLSETVHQLVHSQYIFIPTDKVYGYYKNFVKTYNDSYKEVLEKKYITIDMEGNNQFDKLHELQESLKEKLSGLRGESIQTPNTNFTNSEIRHLQNI